MLNIGGGELLIILLVALVVLGPTRLPEVARQVGQTVSSLRSLASGFQAELEAAAKPDEPATSDSSMTLAGPTSQGEAISATQTDPAVIAAAARNVTFDDGDDAASTGGPTNLNDDADALVADDQEDAESTSAAMQIEEEE